MLANPLTVSYPVEMGSDGHRQADAIDGYLAQPGAALRAVLWGRKGADGRIKEPGPTRTLRSLGFDGDGQGELMNRSWVYPFDHYPHWERAPGRELEPGTFSENLTVFLGIVETEVAVGDVFQVGGATLQVSRGRRAPKWPAKTGRRCWRDGWRRRVTPVYTCACSQRGLWP